MWTMSRRRGSRTDAGLRSCASARYLLAVSAIDRSARASRGAGQIRAPLRDGTPIQSAGCTPPSPAPFWTDLLKSFNRVGCQETVGRWFAVEVALARDLPPMPVPNTNRLSVYRLALTTRFVVVKRWEGLNRPKIAQHTIDCTGFVCFE